MMKRSSDTGQAPLAPSTSASSPTLQWVMDTLWDTSGSLFVSPDKPAAAGAVERFAVLPNAAHPLLLMPLGSRKAASQAVRNYTSGKRGARLTRALLTRGVRWGLAQPLLRDRVHVSLREDVGADDLPALVLSEHLQEVFRRRDVEVAIKFGLRGSERMPTIHVLTRDGAQLGFGKIGWNGHTRRIVVNEARTLELLTQRRRRLRELDVPQLIHAGRWRELELLILAPLPFGVRRRMLGHPPIGATDEIGVLWGEERTSLGQSAFWARTKERIRAMGEHRGADGNAGLQAVVEEVERRHGETVLEFGSRHGDWVPWNMGHRSGRLIVWGWGRSEGSAPRGLDGVQFIHETQREVHKTPPMEALEATLRRSAFLLPEIGVSAAHSPLLLSLHLLEMSLRVSEARAARVDTTDAPYFDALTALFDGHGAASARQAA